MIEDMDTNNQYKPGSTGAGRKKSKPDYDRNVILRQQMDQVVELYGMEEHPSLQFIAEETSLNPIKVRKLLITAGVYKSEIADHVQKVFQSYVDLGLSHKDAIAAVMKELKISKASVTSYLPYCKGLYFPEDTDAANISVDAERIRRMRKRDRAVKMLQEQHDETRLWECIVAFQGYKFRTFSGLPFSYTLKKGRGDEYTRELFIDRRENSKSLAWSSLLMAFERTVGKPMVERPKALGDIRGVSYIYGIFYRFGLIEVPEKARVRMRN